MVGEMKPERFKFAQDSEVREQLRRLLTEPFVARVCRPTIFRGAQQE
jgi:hypothetical protein